ncbi:MiaB-like tRNA modifying enzyme [Treponema sp. JC4]|uniref:tRNA (N(6)-L-threonylcarbamoyladenosine(37)-C(2))- methylthiotransferase MtaB n=1 Tax=Treponema sp. JC4 TaxID=1124982 RepID=UPI00025B0E8F|nr:tRNA (N(6)-L-threonylcarbamoyladenosine(37)-C(2))-methylthiotransferase MtaB [Treponema sp. JC4]EID84104.1 MiaB-like tRNA modifying enzyme [Treponema sp. JC4]
MSIVRIETLGCRLNQIESEAAARFFIDDGFSVDMKGVTSSVPEDTETRLCILNTCTVTQKAEQKARRIIRLQLKKYPYACVLVTGCYAQLNPAEIKAIDKRIAVIGGQIKSRIAEIPPLLKKNLSYFSSENFAALINNKISSSLPQKQGFPEASFKLATSSFVAHSRASIKIQDGCNNSCTYCAIHLARGKSVSIPVETALQRVLELEEKGNDEVVITTVNIGQYRAEYNGEVFNFTRLLKFLLENTKKIAFRISSLYPEVVTDEFCQVIKNPRVRPHFHLSVQSGSDKVLECMNRAYKRDAVITACQKLSQVKDNPFLACDIITGFPGESDEDFEQTMDLCNKCNFSWIHAFPYSERPGTPAAIMKPKVPQSLSGERAKKITDFAIKNKINYVKQFEGKELTAILETVRRPLVMSGKSETMIYHAVTENFIHCEIKTDKPLTVNKSVHLRIVKTLPERILKGGEIEALAEVIS